MRCRPHDRLPSVKSPAVPLRRRGKALTTAPGMVAAGAGVCWSRCGDTVRGHERTVGAGSLDRCLQVIGGEVFVERAEKADRRDFDIVVRCWSAGNERVGCRTDCHCYRKRPASRIAHNRYCARGRGGRRHNNVGVVEFGDPANSQDSRRRRTHHRLSVAVVDIVPAEMEN